MFRRLILLLSLPVLLTADWQAGVGRSITTPQEPVWLSGYGGRPRPADAAAMDLWAKALALQDPYGRRAVVVTTDLIGLSRPVADRIAARAHKRYGLSRDRLLLTSSHTHTGPAITGNLPLMQAPKPEWRAATARYTRYLEDQVVAAIGRALEALEPAELSYHLGKAGFAMNRRIVKPDGTIGFGEDPDAPVDNDVSVLQVRSADGKAIAVLFSYAAHNTTLTGKHMEIHGDYSGIAQAHLEKEFGGQAMYMMGMGADANPSPRGSLEDVEQNGRSMADAVRQALAQPGRPIEGPLRAQFKRIEIRLEDPPSRADWQRRADEGEGYDKQLALLMLERLSRDGALDSTYQYPFQIWKLGDAATLIAMGGEVVVDYSHAIKKALGGATTWTVAYANDVPGYIPSVRILDEGGYEAEFSQTYYGMPGRWHPSIEQTILEAVMRAAEGNQ